MRKYCYEYHYYYKATIISSYNNTGHTDDIVAIEMRYLNDYETLRQALNDGKWFSGRYYASQSHQFKTIYKYYKIMG